MINETVLFMKRLPMHICLLIFALCLLTSLSHAQGMLPSSILGSSSTVTSDALKNHKLLIGEGVPEFLTVFDENNKRRLVLSYKTALDVMVIEEMSNQCGMEHPSWFDYSLLYERYKEWKVAFLAITPDNEEGQRVLRAAMKTTGLNYPLGFDSDNHVAKVLGLSKLPAILILDESGRLQYRGPLDKRKTAQALDAIIGHIDAVKNPELPIVNGCAIEELKSQN